MNACARDPLAPACPINTYQPYLSSDTCLACPANAITLTEAATDLSQCLCAAGYTGPNGGTCTGTCAIGVPILRSPYLGTDGWLSGSPCIPPAVACPANTFKATTGSASCTACPANSATAGTATISATGCVCSAGYVGPNGGPCAGIVPCTGHCTLHRSQKFHDFSLHGPSLHCPHPQPASWGPTRPVMATPTALAAQAAVGARAATPETARYAPVRVVARVWRECGAIASGQ